MPRTTTGFRGKTEMIEVPNEILVSGRFADIRCKRYTGQFVAVNTMRVAKQGDFVKLRKVSINKN